MLLFTEPTLSLHHFCAQLQVYGCDDPEGISMNAGEAAGEVGRIGYRRGGCW